MRKIPLRGALSLEGWGSIYVFKGRHVNAGGGNDNLTINFLSICDYFPSPLGCCGSEAVLIRFGAYGQRIHFEHYRLLSVLIRARIFSFNKRETHMRQAFSNKIDIMCI